MARILDVASKMKTAQGQEVTLMTIQTVKSIRSETSYKLFWKR